ncbi:MAG: hypothetical protein OXH00_25490 [Candidatus Poribacteria bacterium]|nr:hypothetical protein [Candidatus Poribacteria bacterium]
MRDQRTLFDLTQDGTQKLESRLNWQLLDGLQQKPRRNLLLGNGTQNDH